MTNEQHTPKVGKQCLARAVHHDKGVLASHYASMAATLANLNNADVAM